MLNLLYVKHILNPLSSFQFEDHILPPVSLVPPISVSWLLWVSHASAIHYAPHQGNPFLDLSCPLSHICTSDLSYVNFL